MQKYNFAHISDRVKINFSAVQKQIVANLSRHIEPLGGILRDSVEQRKDAVCLYNRINNFTSVVLRHRLTLLV